MVTPILQESAQSFWQKVMFTTSLRAAQLSTPAAWYAMLEEYYFNNGLYDMVQAALYENAIWTPGMKPLRNPANRAVEFYVAKLWAGTLAKGLPLVTTLKGEEAERLLGAIRQVWTWSNWGAQKQVVARWFANMGDLFVKAATKTADGKVTRVYLDPIKPKYVTDMELDERGFLTYIRMDVPNGGETHTEVWSKAWGGLRVWKHNRTLETPLDQLGTPSEQKDFAQLGFDFIPIVHAKFKDVGESRGVGCFVHVLDKIDEANRQATRLHQMLFRYNRPTQAIMANAMDAQGKPLPPPTLAGRDGTSSQDGSVTMGDDDLISLPGMSKLEQLVPALNYDAALSILNAQMDEIREDLPEILYFELKDRVGDPSGVAVERLIGPATDRVIEARGNAEPAMVRANQMALTIAKIHNLPGFEKIGEYELGGQEHSFADRPVIPPSMKETAETIKAEVDTGMPLVFSMRRNGFSEGEIEKMRTDAKEQKETEGALLGNLVLDAMRNRDQNIDQPEIPVGGGDNIADTAMNGAQVKSLVDIITQVANNQLPPKAAIDLISSAFPALPKDKILSMVNSAITFTPEQTGEIQL